MDLRRPERMPRAPVARYSRRINPPKEFTNQKPGTRRSGNRKQETNQQKRISNEDSVQLLGVKIFSNPYILEEIFNHMSLEDLKSCREVNKCWKTEATTSILTNHSTSAYCLFSQLRKNSDPCPLLKPCPIEVILNSSKFLCNNFKIHADHLAERDVQNALQHHGRNIKELEIINDFGYKKSLQGLQYLLKHVSKLKVLTINDIPPEWEDESALMYLKSTILPHLTRLVIHKETNFHSISLKFVSAIIESAVNLKSIGFYSKFAFETCVDLLLSFGKVHLIDYCHLDFTFTPNQENYFYEKLEKFERIANAKPKLRELTYVTDTPETESGPWPRPRPKYQARITEIINKCLESSSKSLKQLSDFSPFLNLPGIQLPPLPNQWQFYCSAFPFPLVDLFEGTAPIFKPGLNFQETFPNVEEIWLDECQDRNFSEKEALEKFRSTGMPVIPNLSVRGLHLFERQYTLQSPILPPMVEYLTCKFPNLKYATFPPIMKFLEASKYIWTNLLDLKELDISICGDPFSDENSFPGLEAAFTGFPIETCYHLYREINEGKEITRRSYGVERLRTNPSIVNLRDLTKLWISFDSRCFWERWSSHRPLLTGLTGKLAFAKCRLMRVEITSAAWPETKNRNPWLYEDNPFLAVRRYVGSICCRDFRDLPYDPEEDQD